MRIIISFLLTFAVLQLSAQVTFKGSVSTGDKEQLQPIPFASVKLTKHNDSLTIVQNAITDMKGEFVMKSVSVGMYDIHISSLGYLSITTPVRVIFPSTGNNYIKHFILNEQSKKLNEVVVVASKVSQDIDKEVYTITKSDLKNAIHSIDLLSKISQLSYDKKTQKLKSLRGGSVKILINGANSTEQELLSINAEDIKSIEYYDFPPARFLGYSTVVNVITRPNVNGLFVGVDIQHAFTTGYFNDGLFLKYNWKENQIAINGKSSYRNYRKVEFNNNYEYILGKDSYQRNEEQQRKFGYDDNYINMIYTRNVNDKYLLQVSFAPNFQHSHNSSVIGINQYVNTILQHRDGDSKNKTNQFTPSADLYTVIKLPHKQELTFDVLYTYHSAKQDYTRNEYDNNKPLLTDIMSQRNNKQSVVGEVNYNKLLGKVSFNTGASISYGNLKSTTYNSFDNNVNYSTSMFLGYYYAELKGKVKKIMYRSSLGVNFNRNTNNIMKYNKWTFKPIFMVGYNQNNNLSYRVLYGSSIVNPTLGELSQNRIFISENIIKEGNPQLKVSKTDLIAIIINGKNKWISSDLVFIYSYAHNPINSYFIETGNYISQKYENAHYMKQLGAQGSIMITPFVESKLLTLKVNAELTHSDLSSIVGNNSYTSCPVDYEITLNWRKFLLSYQGNIRAKSLDGPYLNLNEGVSDLCLRYTNKNLSITATSLWFLTKADYKGRTIGNSIVKYSYINNIINNHSMFTLGFSYRFNSGKKYVEQEKSIKNSDRDSGIF